jgi:hypothetical protein
VQKEDILTYQGKGEKKWFLDLLQDKLLYRSFVAGKWAYI